MPLPETAKGFDGRAAAACHCGQANGLVLSLGTKSKQWAGRSPGIWGDALSNRAPLSLPTQAERTRWSGVRLARAKSMSRAPVWWSRQEPEKEHKEMQM